jgi:hypothetical protein
MAYIARIEKDITGDSFLDELHNSVGPGAFNIDHDYFWGSTDLEIWTAAGKAGTQLTEGVDYSLSGDSGTKATSLTVESGKTVYTTITVINAAYQAVNLYFNGEYIADDNKWDDVEYRVRHTNNIAKSADFTILATERYDLYKVTTGAGLIIATLPTAASMEDQVLKIMKVDTGVACVRISPNGAEQIIANSGASLDYVFLFTKGDLVEIMSDGTSWFIINSFRPYFNSGWINRSDWTDVILGFAQITFAGASGAMTIGEILTEAVSGNTWILIDITGAEYTCVSATGTGIATNGRVLTGNTSAETATVNGDTKNVGTDMLHNWGSKLQYIYKDYAINQSTDGSGTTIVLGTGEDCDTTVQGGYTYFEVNTNTIRLQIATGGLWYISNVAAATRLVNSDWSYHIGIHL